MWKVICDCGTEGIRTSYILKSGKSKSCGCWSAELSGFKRRLPNNKAARNANILKYKSSALKRGITWGLTNEEFNEITSSNCYYCGIEPKQICKVGGSRSYDCSIVYNGIDRLDNNKGYEPDNCVPFCKICNRAKDIMTEKEFLDWVGRVFNHACAQSKEIV